MLEIVATLSVWRITSLLVDEDGPYQIFGRIRRQFQWNEIGNLLDCFLCTSIWVAIPFSLLFDKWFVHIFSLSAGAILIHFVAERLTDNI